MASENQFLYVESPQQPLEKIEWGTIKKNIINPVTKKPYKGIVLQGCFADLSDKKNNNDRIYDVPSYLEILKDFREKVHSKKGVYGELEHPNSYAVNMNNISHKILDVWFDENTLKVMGYVLLLNTPKGKIAREVIETGGCLAISARAAGDEEVLPNGIKSAKVKLLTTYDLVYHPGFSDAILEFKVLNESEKFMQNISESKQGFAYIIRKPLLKNIETYYNQYMDLKESCVDECFLEWFGKNQNQYIYSNLNESDKSNEKIREKSDETKMEKNGLPNETNYEDQLQKTANQELNESDKKRFHRKLKQDQQKTFKQIQQKNYLTNEPLFDGSAGFVIEGFDI